VNLALRAWTPADATLLVEAASDPYVALIEQLEQPVDAGSRVDDPWARVIELEGDPVGGVGAIRRHVPGVAEVGYFVVERARGRGVATQALASYVEWLFAHTEVERVQATVEPWNEASIRALEHCAFEREGLLRRYASWGGERRDVWLYARLRG
jgi:RimJ/RimL family protein N-acetyltransferase